MFEFLPPPARPIPPPLSTAASRRGLRGGVLAPLGARPDEHGEAAAQRGAHRGGRAPAAALPPPG